MRDQGKYGDTKAEKQERRNVFVETFAAERGVSL